MVNLHGRSDIEHERFRKAIAKISVKYKICFRLQNLIKIVAFIVGNSENKGSVIFYRLHVILV